jgi:hypothetical protein
VPSIETITEPLAWRAISPVSMVTVWPPYSKVFVSLRTSSFLHQIETHTKKAPASYKPVPEHFFFEK